MGTRCTARLADGEVEMPKEECRWIDERVEDPNGGGWAGFRRLGFPIWGCHISKAMPLASVAVGGVEAECEEA